MVQCSPTLTSATVSIAFAFLLLNSSSYNRNVPELDIDCNIIQLRIYT